jgi:hypothetical protein
MSDIRQPRSADSLTVDHVVAAADLVGVNIEPEWREGVLFHLKLLTNAAALVESFPLDESLQPAPVFTA